MNIKQLFIRYRNVIPYLFFGVCTTLINMISYWITAHILHINTMPSTIIAWLVAVLFAYVTNRKWVFRSENHTGKAICMEVIKFFATRLSTGILDWMCMYVFVKLLDWNDLIIKFVANILVIILNYVASKLIIFRKTRD